MNLATLNLQKQTLQKALRDLDNIKVNCHSCDRFTGGQCGQFEAAPPPEWVKGPGPVACEHWEFDNIPF